MISKSNFIGQYITDINDHYTVIKELGAGTFGNVYRMQNKLTGDIRACKKLNKRKIVNKERFKIEIDLLKATDHPNIIKLHEIYEDNIYLYLLMEECHGGELFERLSTRAMNSNLYTERDAAKIFKQLMSAINYCHSHGVCHRDIKPENMLFSTAEEDSSLKIIDFGLSKVFSASNNVMKSIVGTSFYIAPEVLKGNYDEKCDIWSAGVILFIMLSGRPPFYGKSDDEIIRSIISKNYSFNHPDWNKISHEVKELLSLIFVDKEIRPSSQDILEHSWIVQLAQQSENEVLNLDWEHLKTYRQLNKLQKSVISFVAFRLDNEHTKNLGEIFKSLDKNSDGVLTILEIKSGLILLNNKCNMNLNEDDLLGLFSDVDLDKNGLINYNEFISATLDYKKKIKNENIYEAFRNFDSDKNGKLSLNELAGVIKPQSDLDVRYLQMLFTEFDKNNDGHIDWEEFVSGLHLLDEKEEEGEGNEEIKVLVID